MPWNTTMTVFVASGVWYRSEKTSHVDVFIRGAGGHGNSTRGGGGGAALEKRRIPAIELPSELVVVVGPAGDAGDSQFAEMVAPGGRSGTNGGAGGLSFMRGGNGSTEQGESVSSGILRLLAGGGGGGYNGGSSGLVGPNVSNPPLWQVGQSGGGGDNSQPGGYPAGGGGIGAPGANGLVTVIEYFFERDPE